MVELSNQFGSPYFPKGGQGKFFQEPKRWINTGISVAIHPSACPKYGITPVFPGMLAIVKSVHGARAALQATKQHCMCDTPKK